MKWRAGPRMPREIATGFSHMATDAEAPTMEVLMARIVNAAFIGSCAAALAFAGLTLFGCRRLRSA